MIVRLYPRRDLMPLLPHSLSINHEYRVLAIEADCYRLLSGYGERDGPYLYEPFFFKIIDPLEPVDWISELGEGGERHARPAGFGKYTWEDYFDGDAEAMRIVRDYLQRCEPCFWEVAPADYMPCGPDKRNGLLDRLALLARPKMQLELRDLFKFENMTEAVLCTLSDIKPDDLRSDSEREAVRRADELAGRIWDELIGDGVPPPIDDFVKTRQSSDLAAAATEALRIFMPAGYKRFLGEPSDQTPFPPTAEDIERARGLSLTDCPRRYCWWWHSMTFDWKMPVAEGCEWLESEYADMRNDLTPCSRCDPSAPRDHYEPREPDLVQDGFPLNHFG